jgi:hypothetical protein
MPERRLRSTTEIILCYPDSCVSLGRTHETMPFYSDTEGAKSNRSPANRSVTDGSECKEANLLLSLASSHNRDHRASSSAVTPSPMFGNDDRSFISTEKQISSLGSTSGRNFHSSPFELPGRRSFPTNINRSLAQPNSDDDEPSPNRKLKAEVAGILSQSAKKRRKQKIQGESLSASSCIESEIHPNPSPGQRVISPTFETGRYDDDMTIPPHAMAPYPPHYASIPYPAPYGMMPIYPHGYGPPTAMGFAHPGYAPPYYGLMPPPLPAAHAAAAAAAHYHHQQQLQKRNEASVASRSSPLSRPDSSASSESESVSSASSSPTPCTRIRGESMKCIKIDRPFPGYEYASGRKAAPLDPPKMPDFQRLVNFPDFLSKKQSEEDSVGRRPVSNRNSASPPPGKKYCVMCGRLRLCSTTGRSHNSNDAKKEEIAHIIPRQNKGVCTSCDVAVWSVTEVPGLDIKWCKGCKNFLPWERFGEKGLATKCVRCRDRQKVKYAIKKYGKTKGQKSKSLFLTVGGEDDLLAARHLSCLRASP